MNNEFTPEKIGENAIREIKDKKPKFSFTTFAVTVAVSVILSTLSGAGGAFIMYNMLIPEKTEESTTTVHEIIVDEEETYLPQDTEITTAESVNAENTLPQESTEESLSDKDESISQNEQSTDSPGNEEIAVPSLSKGDIYSTAVHSIVTIKGLKREYYETWLGKYHRDIQSNGTGFAVTENGYIITNNHVVEGTESITVTDYNGNEYAAKLIGSEPKNDVAVIKIDAKTVAVTLGFSSELKVGDDIMIIGNALGELSYTFTDGIVSHLSRAVNLESGKTINMFQTNAAINNGNSGGPVYNMNGEVVGIASAKYASEKIEGLGFCIPIDDVKGMITDIILYGYVTGKPTLGATLQTVTSSMASIYSIPTGCYVAELDTSSNAYTAGLRSGDVITKLAGKTVSSKEDIDEILADKKAGDKISLTYWRSSQTQTITFTLNEKGKDA